MAATVADHAEELSWLESRNVGKPINGARWEIGAVARVFDYYAGAPARLTGETIPVAKPGLDLTLREPIGVVGLIVPWNFPLMIAAWKLGPALACGNTCVLKPASLTPLTALRLGELALEAGLPPGVLNVVTAPGDVVGAALASHPGIGKVAMTGETATGQEVMRLAAGTIKRVSLELGGKSPNICFADADIDRFVAESPMSVFDNAGQDCCARSRILVERSVHDRVVEGFAAATKRLVVGDPADERTEMGSLVSHAHRDRVQAYVEAGQEQGARLVTGGARPPTRRWPAARISSPRSSTAAGPACASSTRRSSGRSSRSSRSTPRRRRSASRTLARTGCPARSGPVTSAARSAWRRASARASCRSTRNSSVHVEAPFGGYGDQASAASSGATRSTSTARSRTSTSTSAEA